MKQLLNTLYITTEGAWLRLEGETLAVMIDKEKRLQVPLHHLGGIVCVGRVNMSSALMARCMEDGRSIVWLNDNGRFQARVEGPISGNILLRQAQYRAADDPAKTLELARAFIAGKLRNSRQVLLRSAQDNKSEEETTALKKAADAIAINLRNLEYAENIDSIRGLEGDSARIYFEQVNHMLIPSVRLELARAFIAGKLRNSRQVLLRSARDNKSEEETTALKKAADAIAINLRNLEHAENIDSIRGLEGDSARVYFEQVNHMLSPSVRKVFSFETRNRRPPRDPINALFSFLYALLLTDCRSALESVGLDSQLGFLHTVRPGRHALALDLLEEYRAVFGDRLAFTLVNRGQIGKKDFDFNPGGSVLLNDVGRKKLIVAYQERKKEELLHPVLDQKVEIGLIPLLQARFLSRYLRGDTEAYIPYLHK